MSTEPRINFRVPEELHNAVLEKLKKTNGNKTNYMIDLIERDLAGKQAGLDALNRTSPIGDLIHRLEYFAYDDYLANTEDTERSELKEGDYLKDLLLWSLKMIHTPDRQEIALMTRGELEEAMIAAIKQATTNPEFDIDRDLHNMAGYRISAARKRKHLKHGGTLPEPNFINDDPEIPKKEGGWKWISREELQKTLKDFIREEDLVSPEHLSRILNLLFKAGRDDIELTETQKRADAQLEKDIDKLKKNKNETA